MSWPGKLWHFFLLHPGKSKKCSSFLLPALIFSSLYTRNAERDLKTDAHKPLTICWELEAMRAVGQAEGLRIPSHHPSTHMHIHTSIHVRTYTCSHIDIHTYIHTYSHTDKHTFIHKDS